MPSEKAHEQYKANAAEEPSDAFPDHLVCFCFIAILAMPTRINAKGLNIGWTCVRIRCAKSIVIVIFSMIP